MPGTEVIAGAVIPAVSPGVVRGTIPAGEVRGTAPGRPPTPVGESPAKVELKLESRLPGTLPERVELKLVSGVRVGSRFMVAMAAARAAGSSPPFMAGCPAAVMPRAAKDGSMVGLG